jgi:predicted Zn-ribbon and HTH transcriptional regulator
MINIDFSLAIALYIFIFLNAILLIWLASKKQKDKDLTLDPKFIWFCSVCTYTYINTKEEAFSICPRCGSYNKKVLT